MGEQLCKVGDVELCYETFGDRSGQPLLLIMGLGTQMIAWRADFCAMLVDRGFFVIRYDNRDIGRSTHLRGHRPPTVRQMLTRDRRAAAYTLDDMAGDAAGLLDHLGIDAAHVVGASMGGMIAQMLAVRHPDRVLTLTSIMSTTGHRLKGQPAAKVYPFFLKARPKSKDEAVERIVKLFRVVGSPGFARDEDDLRRLAAESWDRGGGDDAGTGRQLQAVLASGNRTRALRSIRAPTLVIHGKADKLIRPSGGRATANAVPGARLVLIDGMGHDLPRGLWPRLVDLIAEHAARAPRRAPAAQAA
ncbi:MAG TPA: alpha/beta fold hydrolase [Solirubrobacteraceae bacterium]|nr:alpha/beta fold hydrolase [Solirubrobacteraceae bacterium]